MVKFCNDKVCCDLTQQPTPTRSRNVLFMTNRQFPSTRLRRTRQTDWSRRLVAENNLSVNDLIWPVFVQADGRPSSEISSMPGVFRYSLEELIPAVREARDLGIPAIALFPETQPDRKSWEAEEAINPDNLMCRTVRAIKGEVSGIGIICDVALDPYTLHGQDGLVRKGKVVNDPTVKLLCQQALVQAQAGCDIIAPSDMMDGRIGAIRHHLDSHGFENVLILAYAAKYASAFYGPFRDAIGSGQNLASGNVEGGGKQTYQMQPSNGDEALHEVELDLNEGADLVMVKPGLPYLDVIYRVKQKFRCPTFAYQVSGEYAMLAAAFNRGWLDRKKAVLESLLGFKRAGADGVLTYFAVEVARLLKNQNG
jgi:porphobilinogen synthase